MRNGYSSNGVKAIALDPINPNEPAGFVFETSELSHITFANWGPDNIPPQVVKEALAREIAKAIEYDVYPLRDPKTGETKVRYSTTVYMKPDNKALKERVDELTKELKEERERNSELHETISYYLENEETLNRNKGEIERLYEEKMKEWNSWSICLKRGFYLAFIKVKISISSFVKNIPYF